MIVLLDTNILIDALRRRNNRPAELEALVDQGHLLATSAINIGEVYAGLRIGEEARTESFLSNFECYPMTAEIARRAGLLKVRRSHIGQTFSLPDMIVAATAMEHDLVLMTDNRKDFPFPELLFHPA